MTSADVYCRELDLICALVREVADRRSGVTTLLRDAVPRVELVTPAGVVADVRIDGGAFVWQPSFQRHPCADVSGAASAVIAFLATCDGSVRVGGDGDDG